ncbi:MAG: hypothetical protein ABI687_09030, partial [Flavitalea sp.]
LNIAGGGPSSWTATNEFTFGKDLMLDFLGCANLLWSAHIVEPNELKEIVRSLVPSIRTGMRGKELPSEEGNITEPVDISAFLNFSKSAKDLSVDLSNLKSGDIKNRSAIFHIKETAATSGKCAIVVGSKGTGDNLSTGEVNGIKINEDVSSLIFLQSCALPSGNQKSFFNVPNTFDSPDLLGWYEIVYEDGFKTIVPIQYGLNVLEWNAAHKASGQASEAVMASQGDYSYEADAIDCSANSQASPVTCFAFEWVNPRFGKVVKEVNLHGSVNYQSLLPEFDTPLYKPMAGNAILLFAISKVKKQERIMPR